MVFKFLKKKKEDLPLPPPPTPPTKQPVLQGDIEPIRAPQGPPMPRRQAQPLPEMPQQSQPTPPAPQPKKPAPAGTQQAIPAPMPHYLEEPRPEPPIERTVPEMPEKAVFDKTIEEPPEQIHIPLKPAFVAVNDYKRIINDTNTIRAKLMDAESFIKRLSDIKNEEERTFDKWRNQLEDVEKKLSYVDQLIAQAQR